ncbi:hypothetical protein F2P81_025404 [Scophthalmus maximus]|uniref:Uncharacterized protein n=1 Tax=Scophthalmus maximus TaxID=52904 RepID=A0A6A4RPY6_SCOMX|nr:hypothetical protein F2P81_026323 [Scophthalmus maximus]KAF0022339.1 hypothetical protein F2P81_025404 [Scophthalmus maximus]
MNFFLLLPSRVKNSSERDDPTGRLVDATNRRFHLFDMVIEKGEKYGGQRPKHSDVQPPPRRTCRSSTTTVDTCCRRRIGVVFTA